MFHFDDDLEMYVAEIDGVEFACEEPREDYEEEARKLARLYREKQPELTAFLLPELQEIFEGVTAANLFQKLGKPTVDLDTFQIQYFDQTLDEGHIIQCEYDEDFEGFSCFSLDG